MTIDHAKFQWNLNTILTAITLLSVIVSGIAFGVNQTRDFEELKQKWVDHDKLVETSMAENREVRGKQDARTVTLEDKTDDMARKQDQLVYRVTVIETSLATQAQQQQKVSDDLNEVKSDLRVVKEILLRQEAANKRRAP